MKSNARTLGAVGGLAVVLALGGCGKTEAPKPAVAAAPKAAETPVVADRYPLTGEITGVDVARTVLVVQHDEIKGYMPAMTMEFLVSAADLAAAKVGQRIRADMIPSKAGDFRLEKIWPDDRAATAAIAAGARGLREDTMTRGKNAYSEVGEAVPDFTLYDQEGRVVQGARFRGKMVMINFIFTRCPVATISTVGSASAAFIMPPTCSTFILRFSSFGL